LLLDHQEEAAQAPHVSFGLSRTGFSLSGFGIGNAKSEAEARLRQAGVSHL